MLIIGLFMLFISSGFNVGRSCDPTLPFPDTYSKNSVSYYKDLRISLLFLLKQQGNRTNLDV